MQRGRQKYSWEEDSRFQAANDDHDEEWPRAEPARAAVRRSGGVKKARRARKSPFLAALQGASVAIFAVVALGLGGMFVLGISPGDFGFSSKNEAPDLETASLDSLPAPSQSAPQRKDIAAAAGEAFTVPVPNGEPIRQPVAVRPAAAEEPAAAPAAAAPTPSVVEPVAAEPPPAPRVVAAAPPPAAPAEKLKLSVAERTVLMTRAEEAIKQGDVSSARLLLARAAKAEDPDATLLLAQTYDPNMLDSWGSRGVKPDPEKARALYTKAEKLGSQEAATLLGRLN